MASPKISSSLQNKIEKLIKKWHGKLTWALLVDRIELEFGFKTTRQTLCTYTGIDTSYHNKKSELRGATPALYTKMTASDVGLVKQNDNLVTEVEDLKEKNAEQFRMIERMLSNANDIPNLDLKDLVKRRPEENR